MKPTIVVIGTCYSGISKLAQQQCLIAQEPVTKQLYLLMTKHMDKPLSIDLHMLYSGYYSVVINTLNHEVKTHD